MRVVGGSARGFRLETVPGEGTRPIQDRVKTALFDILRPRIDGRSVLDLFAGSGSVGIESLSQGAASCVFNDAGMRAVATIRKNLATTGFTDRAEVRHGDAFGYLKRTPESFDLIYIAPPQYKKLWIEAMTILDQRPQLLRTPEGPDEESGLAIVQIDPREYQPLELSMLRETRQKRYGNSLLVFYERGEEPALNHESE
jgi:16S rRNA (guanine(966)-N(2))-methyltransferase RsmD